MNAIGSILLLTGIPGIGKTTVIKKAVAALAGCSLAGFYTEEMRVHNVRQGFALVTLQGKRLVMAHVAGPSAYRVGRFGVDVPAIDAVVTDTLSVEQGAEIFIVDEIGRMECLSPLFVLKMSALLESGRPVVATVARKGGGFIAGVKKRADAELWEVTLQNRNDMADRIASWVRKKLIKPEGINL